MSIAQLKNEKLFNKKYSKKPKALKEKADKTFYLGYDFREKNNPLWYDKDSHPYENDKNPIKTPMINNISFMVSIVRYMLLLTVHIN